MRGCKNSTRKHNFDSIFSRFFSSKLNPSQASHDLVVQGGLPADGPAPAREARRGLGAGVEQLVDDGVVFGRLRPYRRRRFFSPLLLLGRAHDRAASGAHAPDAGVVERSGSGHAADDAAQRGQDRLRGHAGKKFFSSSFNGHPAFFKGVSRRLFLLVFSASQCPLCRAREEADLDEPLGGKSNAFDWK